MILYNVTISIDTSVEEDWLQWMKEIHIPDVMNTGLFIDNKIYYYANYHRMYIYLLHTDNQFHAVYSFSIPL